MEVTVKQFVKEFKQQFQSMYAYSYEEGSNEQLYNALGLLVKNYISSYWKETREKYIKNSVKQVYYFSMEFLPGRQLRSNAYNLGLLDVVKEGLSELELSFDQLAEAEADPALGNGGLGRLASCFMDSLASLGMAGNGNGIRYQYGLFRQKFVDGYQVELPENWLRYRNVWETRNDKSTCMVRFGGNVWLEENHQGHLVPHYENTLNVLAVPYDTPMVGYRNDTVNNLRLWSAEIPVEEEANYHTIEETEPIKEITQVLYPDDSNYEGRLLRLKQEYFMVSAGVQSIIRHFRKYNVPRKNIPDKVAIHINDTHPALVVPELMRILIDEEHLSWEQAWEITFKTCSYTNHTILREALEKWPIDMMKELLPRIYMIIEEINNRFVENTLPLYGERITWQTAILQNGVVNMAHLAVIGSHSVNGVAKLHTDILMNDVLKDFFELYPERFNNKTNGITQRRWVHLANPELTKLIDEKIGENWKLTPSELKVFKGFEKDKDTLNKLTDVKLKNKKRLADYIKEVKGITVDPNALFDVQIKRLHAYKRQHLNLLHILHRYLEIKADPSADYVPRVFIFGAKAAPSYHYAKQIIKVINSLADLVNNDPDVGDKLKIVFFENYGVSLAEKIIPAADISEQISLASMEASGTSNMKLMANGALTLATLDGANIEIKDFVGEENLFVFGLSSKEVYELKANQSYQARELYESNPKLKNVLDALTSGTIPNLQDEGYALFDSLVNFNDEYFVLKDFASYVEAQNKVDDLYKDQNEWARKSLLNIASSAPFSADYTIQRYADDIWKVRSCVEEDEGVHLVDEPLY
ncbi:glycogen/starch/alpha-glucan phosphorylase [Alkalibacterium pelagium]|uniref:Alpha-1,4 glucan phosphorylase n=1 Tax=Alkalibacterium pelagium TaxID=426702 RepID=A0A1H7F3G6_9LACT|nr:glycogen/starch/alpha-glucan phosphorylase [Alkalibacterium pelagium]GEN49491.1 alpha-1,4 glucan phosphorylase [Alkalibacterium pelagium]SEK20696.1 starch phosphorylase [Alkalibacterium pelagium]